MVLMVRAESFVMGGACSEGGNDQPWSGTSVLWIVPRTRLRHTAGDGETRAEVAIGEDLASRGRGLAVHEVKEAEE